jgi:hypothetical protein
MVKAANMLVPHNREHIPFQSPYLHSQILLALCQRTVKVGSDIDTNHIANKGGQTLTIHTGHSTTFELYNMQRSNLLMLFSCSGDTNF